MLFLLAYPEIASAVVGLMSLYVRYGPAIISALSETPLPMATGRHVVIKALAEGEPLVTDAIRQEARAWYRYHQHWINARGLNADNSLARGVDIVLDAKHESTLAIWLRDASKREGVRKTVRSKPDRAVNLNAYNHLLPPAASVPAMAPTNLMLLAKHNLTVIRGKSIDAYELRMNNGHLAYIPEYVMHEDHKFNAWLTAYIKQKKL